MRPRRYGDSLASPRCASEGMHPPCAEGASRAGTMVEAEACSGCRALIRDPATAQPHAHLTTDGTSRITLADARYDLYRCEACGTRFMYRRARESRIVTWTALAAA